MVVASPVQPEAQGVLRVQRAGQAGLPEQLGQRAAVEVEQERQGQWALPVRPGLLELHSERGVPVVQQVAQVGRQGHQEQLRVRAAPWAQPG